MKNMIVHKGNFFLFLLSTVFLEEQAVADIVNKKVLVSQLEEVVVTARRRQESLQEAPVATTALDAESLELRSIMEVKDLSSLAPNLQINETPRGGSIGSVTLRGQQNINQFISNDPAVGIYFDEVYLGRSAGLLTASMLDMAQIQVLRGVQGTLFGRNNTGGAILFSPKRPNLHELEGMVKLGYGSENRKEATVLVDMPLLSDTLGMRLAYNQLEQDGVARSVSTGIDSYGDRDRKSGRAAIRYLPSSDLTIDFAFDFSRMEETGSLARSLSFPVEGLDFYESTSGFSDPQVSADAEGYTFRAEYQLASDTAIKFIAGRRQIDYLNWRDIDGTPLTAIDVGPSGDQEQWTGEVNISGSTVLDEVSSVEALDYVVGLFYFKESGNEFQAIPWFSEPYVTGRTTYADGRNESEAAYAQGEVRLVNGLSLWAGARYTRDDRYFAGGGVVNGECAVVGLPAASPANQCELQGRDNFAYWSWTSGIRYEITDHINGYLRVSEGQRAGGLDDAVTNVTSFEPEVVTEYELGVKADWLDRRVRTNLAVFYSDYEKVQRVALLEDASGLPYTSVFNAANATISGAELEFILLPTNTIKIEGAVSYLNAEYNEFVDPRPGPTLGFDASGNDFQDTPEFSYNLSVEHRIGSGSGEFISRLDWSWKKATQFAVFNNAQLTQPHFGLLNARMTYALESRANNLNGIEVSIWGRNLLDKEYDVAGLQAASFYTVWRSDQPRMFGVDVKLLF